MICIMREAIIGPDIARYSFILPDFSATLERL
jgi:hypothetical protein